MMSSIYSLSNVIEMFLASGSCFNIRLESITLNNSRSSLSSNSFVFVLVECFTDITAFEVLFSTSDDVAPPIL